MKRRHPQHRIARRTHALAAFVATVVLAVLATVMVMLPDFAVQAADSMSLLPAKLGQMFPAGLFD
jgi:hypothetical protein